MNCHQIHIIFFWNHNPLSKAKTSAADLTQQVICYFLAGKIFKWKARSKLLVQQSQ